MVKRNRGGKRSNNGGIKKNTGFSFTNQNGKTVTLQINSAGVILVNGSPNKSMTLQKYQAMYNAQKIKPDLKHYQVLIYRKCGIQDMQIINLTIMNYLKLEKVEEKYTDREENRGD